ncbi:MAG: hypothetical protein LBR85_06590 [Oscillospiraceae bacterium]|jgi:hypothetical protein|nr:hypothetical protein [Oscillospiraceae bacterium]
MLKKRLDELQLLKRGIVFKHGLFTLVALLLINALLYSQGIEWVSGKWGELIIVFFVIVLCNIEFIYYDISPLGERRQKYLIFFCGLLGATTVIACTYELVMEDTGIIVDGKINRNVLGILFGIMILAIFIAYMLKAKFNTKREDNE